MPPLAATPTDFIESEGSGWIKSPSLPTSGPYTLESWRLNDRIRLRKSPSYWDAANTMNKSVDLLTCGPSTALNLYNSEAVDVIWDKTMIPTELLPELKETEDFHAFPSLGVFFVRLNTTRAPLNSPLVRQALALSIDKERLVQRVVRGSNLPAENFVPPGIARYTSKEGAKPDLALAKQSLIQAGFQDPANFPQLEILFPSSGANSVFENMALELRDQWQSNLGIHLNLRRMEKKVYFRNQRSLDYDISCSNWTGDLQRPHDFFGYHATR